MHRIAEAEGVVVMSPERAISLVLDEFRRATNKNGPFNSMHEGYAVILEELDEAWDAIKMNSRREARDEMVQVCAMALRFLVDCTRDDEEVD